jgi:hypothetical protein
LFVAQPKQVPAHNPDPLPTTNQDRIVRAKKLMSSDPSSILKLSTVGARQIAAAIHAGIIPPRFNLNILQCAFRRFASLFCA